MSEEPVVVKSIARWVMKWVVRLFLCQVLLVLLVMVLSPFFVTVEAPFHFLFGWLMHMAEVFPPLLGSWKKVLPPLGCLILAGFMVHRFVRWSLKAKGNPLNWRPAHTITAMGIVLLGCAAAIAMSGIAHQIVWLSKDPWTETRGRKSNEAMTVSNARQIGLALFEFHETEGRYPNSLQELEGIDPMIDKIIWVKSGRGNLRESFILLKPGGTMSSDGIEPLIVSPVIGSEGKIVVGYSDNTVMSLPAERLETILQGGAILFQSNE